MFRRTLPRHARIGKKTPLMARVPTKSIYSIEDQFRICTAASAVRIDSQEIGPGDVYFAVRQKVPAGGMRRRIWEAFRWLELHAPRLIPLLVRLGARTRWADDLEMNRRRIELIRQRDAKTYARMIKGRHAEGTRIVARLTGQDEDGGRAGSVRQKARQRAVE